MRCTLILTALALLGSVSATAAGQDAPPALPPASHHEAAAQVVELLRDTDACLASCTDAASVQAALPRLRDLADRAARLKAAQELLPDPTQQDYMVGPALVQEFNAIWKSIRAHIDRLESQRLISDEMRDILRISPPQSGS